MGAGGGVGRALFPSGLLSAFSRSEGSAGPESWEEGLGSQDSSPLNRVGARCPGGRGRRDLTAP